jgi:copper chaperone
MMETIKLTVEGMSCEHCVRAVTSALSKLKGIGNVKVDLASKTIIVEFNSDLISLTEIKETITDEGYTVV